MKHVYECIIIFLLGISLLKVNLILSTLVLMVTLIYTSAKLMDFILTKIKNKKNEKNNNATI